MLLSDADLVSVRGEVNNRKLEAANAGAMWEAIKLAVYVEEVDQEINIRAEFQCSALDNLAVLHCSHCGRLCIYCVCTFCECRDGGERGR